jgi:hypothetical protein
LPFSLGHSLILKEINSPFLKESGEVGPNDLIVALKVCSKAFPFSINLDLTFRERVLMHYLNYTPVKFREECEKFQFYLDQHSYHPEYWASTQDSSKSAMSSPGELAYVVTLMDLGFSHSEAWNLPCDYVSWVVACRQEMKGSDMAYSDPIDGMDDLEHLKQELTEDEIYKVLVDSRGEKAAKEYMRLRSQNGR